MRREGEGCGTCAAWHDNGQGGGECRVNPPLVLVIGGGAQLDPRKQVLQRHSYWPPVGAGEWCGAYRAKARGLRAFIAELRARAAAWAIARRAKRSALAKL